MSIPIEEHDYIGISEFNSEKTSVSTMESTNKDLNFKAAELGLGLPGSESPPLGILKNFPSGAKMVFYDTMNGDSGTWGFESEVDCVKNSGFVSPTCVKVGNKILGSVCNESSLQKCVKEAIPKSLRPVQEKKFLVSSTSSHVVTPAAKTQVVGWPQYGLFGRIWLLAQQRLRKMQMLSK